ncbi:hypothetical protein BCR34DRAFT_677999 [Clohesyomyces aquaticus]|uniref:Uncharacterized protein n=1 Tax=Clohesyomyces aquaticus TaxID=1231657 RepID=A0A1Y1XYY4_9PLEO|nr:hypothetical protein BCR34DRAFT_677999 [Clohesyomyces aquaticus]
MATQSRALTVSSKFDSSSSSIHGQGRPPSMLYTVLPTALQNRIPTLPSIRRSLSGFRGYSPPGKKLRAEEASEPESPPPGYTSRDESEAPHGDWIVSSDAEGVELGDNISERRGSSGSMPPPFQLPETDSGINWKYANQGISLTTQAYQESSDMARGTDDDSILLTRQLYMHGITYLLRGVPSRLTQDEILSIHAAIPASIAEVQNDPNSHAVVPLAQQGPLTPEERDRNPSLLHRTTAWIIFQTFVLVQCLLPYVRLFLEHAYRWEREHRVTHRVLNTGIMTVDELGRRSLQLSRTVCQMHDGKVGQAINDLALWWVQGLTGGIHQGISEGISRTSRIEKIE